MQDKGDLLARALLKRELLHQLASEIDRLLPRSRQVNEDGRVARRSLLKLIVESLAKFPPELRPPALRGGVYYDEIALAIVECNDPSFLHDERNRYSLYRVIRTARSGGAREWLIQKAIESEPQGSQLLPKFSKNLKLMEELPDPMIPPTENDVIADRELMRYLS